jgi:chitinase
MKRLISVGRRVAWVAAASVVAGVVAGTVGVLPAAADGEEVSVADASVAEGASGAATMLFTVTLTRSGCDTACAPVEVSYSTASNFSAGPGSDYLTSSGTLSWGADESGPKTIGIPVAGDSLPEPNETFQLNISSSSAAVTDPQAVGTITNDDVAPPPNSISARGYVIRESGPSNVANVGLVLSNFQNFPVQVTFHTADGTAEAGEFDYQPVFSGTVTIPAGSSTGTAAITIHNDGTFEPSETFDVVIDHAQGITIHDATGTVTIVADGDPQPSISVGDVIELEGSGDTASAVQIGLSNPSSETITVDWATADGTATAGSDYTAASGTATFPPGSWTAETDDITVHGDTTYEPDEAFVVNLSNPVNATIDDGQVVWNLLNDDAQPSISVGDVTETEGDSGTKAFDFTVSLSNPSFETIGVSYATADGTAKADDYTSASGTLTFQPGDTAKHVLVQVAGNAFYEPDETFNLSLSAPVNATISDATATGTIQNDDSQEFSVSDASVTEGDEGTANATFTVSLLSPATSALSVQYATATDTATSADFQSRSGTVTFAAGQSSKTITVAVKSDVIDEPTETFFVNLSNPSNFDIADGTGEGTITDNDPTPGLSIGDVTLVEGNSGTTTKAVFQLSLSNPSSQYVSVDYDTDNGTATAPGDYKARTGTRVFQPGQTTKTITVPVVGDNTQESNETFTVSLLDPDNAEIVDGEGLGTITDNDAPTISINNPTTVEGNTGTKNLTFTVTLSHAATSTITVQFATADGTAVAPADYTAKSGTLTFTAGQLSKTIAVAIKGDLAVEPNETFFVNLSNPTNATIADDQGIGTINNND